MEADEDELAHDDWTVSPGICPQCSGSMMWDTGKLVCLGCGYSVDLTDE